MPASEADKELVRQIRAGDESAWSECIRLYEGRLQAFVRSRLGNQATAEDVVQETFIGFLTALPNFDDNTPIETFLFAIAANKLTDVLRKQGRRPTLPLGADNTSQPGREPAGQARMASSIARSRESHLEQNNIIATCLTGLVEQWFEKKEFERLKCAELLFVSALPNKDVADTLGITEQAVANHKYFIVGKLKEAARQRQVNVDWTSLGVDESSDPH